MADDFPDVSCLLDVGTAENAACAVDLDDTLFESGASKEPPLDGFLVSIQPEHGGSQLWLQDDVSAISNS